MKMLSKPLINDKKQALADCKLRIKIKIAFGKHCRNRGWLPAFFFPFPAILFFLNFKKEDFSYSG